jgi:hypothetical protein
MFHKAVASLLLVLVASPFTAPCETCDIATLFGIQTTLTQVQVEFARSVDADSQAMVPGTTARRIRLGLRFNSIASTPAFNPLASQATCASMATRPAACRLRLPAACSPLRI